MATWSNRYFYSEGNVRKYAPVSGGVYRLIHRSGDNYYVYYVGQANNLERRLLEHLQSSEPNGCIKRHQKDYTCYFRFIEVPSASERDRIEEEQIREYNPDCNRQRS
ncbi:MAG: GIY-YIG nuclease family protein [Planctomycetota bacterium]|jgi:excinuclease UvrABC nuclease subunit